MGIIGLEAKFKGNRFTIISSLKAIFWLEFFIVHTVKIQMDILEEEFWLLLAGWQFREHMWLQCS